jgi:hypothetical protein
VKSQSRRISGAVGAMALLVLATVVLAADNSGPVAVPIESIKLGPLANAPGGAPPPGVVSAVIIGDITKPGIYVLRNKWPANATLAPHTHHGKWRIYTVLEGELRWGFGSKIDEAKMVRLGPGSVASTGAGDEPHYFITGPQGATINVVAEGPFDSEFVKP